MLYPSDMKPKKRPQRLAIQRETLRLLSDAELATIDGGGGANTLAWCSTESLSKCQSATTPPCRHR